MTRPTLAVVPLRSLTAGKTRLAGALDAEARAELIRLMFGNVLRALSESRGVDRIAVVSPEPAALALAANLVDEVELLAQPTDRPGLLPALELGRELGRSTEAAALLVLFGDLPRVTPADVHALLAPPAEVVVAPDRDRVGTNGLVLRGQALDSFAFRFGDRSYPAHRDEAARQSLSLAVVEREGLGFDLDTPGDLASAPDEMTTVTTWMTAL